MNSLLYADNWSAIAAEIKAANFYTCQECGKVCRRPDEPFDTHDRTLAVAHYDQDYESPEIFVACICRRCHMLHDAPYGWQARLRNMRLRLILAGQLEIFNRPI